jgi:hypothetical protein
MDGLKKKDNFFQMQSQLRVSALLKIKYDVSLEEPVVNENGDEITAINILVAIGNSQIIIEVTSLDMFRDLKYLGSVMDIKNRAKEKITQKVEKQISKIASVYPVPILLLIDKSRAPEIDLEDIYDALGGTSTVNLVRDKETPEIRQFYMSRVNDGIGLTIKGGDRLSAIILVIVIYRGKILH